MKKNEIGSKHARISYTKMYTYFILYTDSLRVRLTSSSSSTSHRFTIQLFLFHSLVRWAGRFVRCQWEETRFPNCVIIIIMIGAFINIFVYRTSFTALSTIQYTFGERSSYASFVLLWFIFRHLDAYRRRQTHTHTPAHSLYGVWGALGWQSQAAS